IWAMQGYNDSTPTADGKKQQAFRQGFFRFRPDGSDIEFIRSTNNNTWGLGISEEGLIFGSTANHNPSVYMPIANRYYERVRGWTASLQLGTIADTHLFNPITKNIRQVDHHGGYTAAAGHALYTARQYPPEYWNRTAFVNGPTGHLVGTFVLKSDGSDFHSSSPFNLFASDDEWTAPIMSEVGPDGNVWVIDWYNYIVQHNPTPKGFSKGKGNAYESNVRDKKHGRIYRVVHGDTPKPMTLEAASGQTLVQTLTHPTMLWRKHAQRLLVERGETDVVADLIALIHNPAVDSIGLNVGAIHALWTLHGLGQLDGSNAAATEAAATALRHPSAGVRRNAVQVVPPQADSVQAILAAGVIDDADAQVRLATALALADLPASDDAGRAVFQAMQAKPDRWLSDALVSAAATNADSFLSTIAASETPPTGQMFESMEIVANHYGRSGPVDSIPRVVRQLATANAEVAEAILAGVSRGWPADAKPELTETFEQDLIQLMEGLPTSSRGQLVSLARSWGSEKFEKFAREISESLIQQIDDDDLAVDKRRAAAHELVVFRSSEADVVEELLERITPQMDPNLAMGLVQAVAKSEAAESGEILADYFDALTPGLRSVGIRILLTRPQWTRFLLDAIDQGDILLSELDLEQQQSLSDHPSQQIKKRARELLSRGGALPNEDRLAVMKQMMPATENTGDVAAGKKIFTKNCANCHMHSGEGQKVGPDLTGMAVHPKAELLTHILDPNRDVEGNYRVYTLLTTDGSVVNGLLASESKTSIEMY
ncbi:MAG: c-type cytochrome, partial [Pirellulaceae bacterium]|nr:c-type cytochrome [Pirellulaceae bacterium]